MSFRFPLSFQTTLPDDFQSNTPFRSLLETLRALGFWGVELNIGDLSLRPRGAVEELLSRFDLSLSMLATGLTAKRFGLSLSHADTDVRERSIEACRAMIDWVDGSRAGLIIGFLKGGTAADPPQAQDRLRRSLERLLPRAVERGVQVLLEATNRYESSVANTVEESVSLLKGLDPGHAFVLPDTFHMNIEEADMLGALKGCLPRVTSIHLSDNNRLFPGLGAIRFAPIIELLVQSGFHGRLAIEGNSRGDVEKDLRASMEVLAPLLS